LFHLPISHAHHHATRRRREASRRQAVGTGEQSSQSADCTAQYQYCLPTLPAYPGQKASHQRTAISADSGKPKRRRSSSKSRVTRVQVSPTRSPCPPPPAQNQLAIQFAQLARCTMTACAAGESSSGSGTRSQCSRAAHAAEPMVLAGCRLLPTLPSRRKEARSEVPHLHEPICCCGFAQLHAHQTLSPAPFSQLLLPPSPHFTHIRSLCALLSAAARSRAYSDSKGQANMLKLDLRQQYTTRSNQDVLTYRPPADPLRPTHR
jgi:hypothetical protein